jgi:septal ring factor EnvC (AmiA/AmiB activator)
MAIWDIIPTCDDAMSVYSLCAIATLASAGFVVATIAYWWASNELKALKKSIEDHEEYIKETAEVFSKIQTKLAVQESSMETLKNDIGEIKTDVKTLLSR